MNKNTPVRELKGVGEKRAELYSKIGITTVEDLIFHFPRRYTDYSEPVSAEFAQIGEHAVIEAMVVKKNPAARIRQGLVLYKIFAEDNDGTRITIVYYNNRFAADALHEGEEYLFSGKISGNFTRKEMNSPTVLKADEKNLLRPVYPLTEGLTAAMVTTNVSEVLDNADDIFFADSLPDSLRLEYSLSTLEYALKNIHFPKDQHAAEVARRRLAFDELLRLQLGMILIKNRTRTENSCKMSHRPKDMETFRKSLPFEMTNAQKRAVEDIIADMQGGSPMNRLLQGDVGSGKTAVAAAASLFAAKNGFQTALMAPTEILASQHFKTLSEMLEPLGISVCRVMGSMTKKQRTETAEKIASGGFMVAVGTHALISGSTEFRNLGLVITDEQHRFGVGQRSALAEKGVNPHKLVMSATPIPRTLALIIYGDLDISVLNELPKGRQKTETYAVTSKLRDRALGFVKKQLDEGGQAYIVCPMIEENENELAAAKGYAEGLKKTVLAEYRAGLLHGKMSAAEKDKVMSAFKAHELDILVATTVVEVGVDVPNANIIVIENADRFGLSQLHQLRGRVGRGKSKSYCVLIAGNVTDESRQRLEIMTKTSDGFEISEYDLKMRGAGDFFGNRQHGLPDLKLADIAADRELLADCQRAAKELLGKSPDLGKYPALKAEVEELFSRNDNAAEAL
ncbi:MAG: ATP-dependent DNA helicase RecG [Oscillospiraceae bacterium]|nr:ATP-dependent DNA helicase RecG [Oscillospiraceae bacterium]